MKNWRRTFREMKHQAAWVLVVLLSLVSMPAVLRSQPPQPGQLAATQPSSQSGVLQLPNTMSAPPLTVGDKFDYRVVQTFGLRGLLGAGVGAAIGQGFGNPYSWGGGVEGFAKRYGSGFAGNLSRQTMAFGIESVLHEDPRYFPSEDKPAGGRMLNALKQVFVCKTDSDHSSFAYGRVVSAFAAGQLVNAWQPASNASAGNGLRRGVLTLGGDLAYNFAQEFIPFTRPKSIRHRP